MGFDEFQRNRDILYLEKTHFAVGNLHTGHNQTTSCIKRTLKIITFLISNTDLVRI